MKKLLLSIAFLLPGMGMMAQTQVTTAKGILEGKDLSGITVFKGIPFAAPPVGNLRWKAPQPVQKWQGVREAKEFGPNPMQEPLFGDMNFGTKTNSEDCLLMTMASAAMRSATACHSRESCGTTPAKAIASTASSERPYILKKPIRRTWISSAV